jgi:hypothetical protein
MASHGLWYRVDLSSVSCFIERAVISWLSHFVEWRKKLERRYRMFGLGWGDA